MRRSVLRQRRERLPVGLLDSARPGLDVRAVDVQRGGRLLERPVDERAQPLELRREVGARLLELRLVRDLRERARLARRLRVPARQRLLAGRIDEERRHVVRELVAGRALDRPVAQPLARLEDLLDPDVLDAFVAQPLEVAARVGEPVGVVDAQPVDEPLAHELEHLVLRQLEDLGVLDAHAGELVDREEAAVPPALRVAVEDLRAQPLVGPPAVLLARGHVVRDDVEHHAEPGARELAERRPRRRAAPRSASGRRRRSRASSPTAPA